MKEDKNKQEGEMSDQHPFFIFGSVFDVSQTEPIEAAEKPYYNQAGAVVTPGLREEWNKMQAFVSA